jgi:hypothetical protein
MLFRPVYCLLCVEYHIPTRLALSMGPPLGCFPVNWLSSWIRTSDNLRLIGERGANIVRKYRVHEYWCWLCDYIPKKAIEFRSSSNHRECEYT